ncbi:hypothetical protein GCM10027053_54240 [Intrasporangium mesophilum]
MPLRHRSPLLLTTAVALAASQVLAACGGADPTTAPQPTDVGTVHLPTAKVQTTDSSGHRIEQLPVLPPAPMSERRVRGEDYSYALPVAWSPGRGAVDPPPDTLVLPDDSDTAAVIAVERPFKAGSRTLAEVVDKLRAGFAAKGFQPKAAPERDIAGYHAQGIVVDQSDDLRHVYYVVVYTDQVYAVRLSYTPATPDPLAVLRGVLDSWLWG